MRKTPQPIPKVTSWSKRIISIVPYWFMAPPSLCQDRWGEKTLQITFLIWNVLHLNQTAQWISHYRGKMRGGKRAGSGRKKKPSHLKRELLTIRLPLWMIEQIKSKGEISYIIENQLKKNDFPELPDDYDLGGQNSQWRKIMSEITLFFWNVLHGNQTA